MPADMERSNSEVFEVQALTNMPGETRIILISGRTGAPVGEAVDATLISPDGQRFDISAYKEFVPKEEGDTREAFMLISPPPQLAKGWRFLLR